MALSRQNKKLLYLAMAVQASPIVSSLWAIGIDIRSARYIWPYLLAGALGVICTVRYSLNPSFRIAMAAYYSLVLLCLALAYGIVFWPWVALGGVPQGQTSWTISGASSTFACLFFAWPLLFKVHQNLSIAPNTPFNSDPAAAGR